MVENEVKYVLQMYPDLEPKIKKLSDTVFWIEQGYLCRTKGLTVRLRKQRDKKKTWHVMTVKTRVKPDRVIEIEKIISEEDFDEMVPLAAGWLKKIRYVVGLWEVDFFKNDDNTYFVMAEIELPDGVKKPSKIPGFVSENLLFEVPREDNRFTSKKLSDLSYAQKLLVEITDNDKTCSI